MAYSDKVIDHYENPRNVGKMNAEDPDVGTGMVGAPACGDVMRLPFASASFERDATIFKLKAERNSFIGNECNTAHGI